MNNGRFTKLMWLILVICVAVVTVIAKVFGLRALVVFVIVVSLALYLIEENVGRSSGNKNENKERSQNER